MTWRARRDQRGVTLLELIMGLSIIILVIGTGFVVFNQARRQSDIRQSVDAVHSLVVAITNLYALTPTYAGLTVQVLRDSGKLHPAFGNGANLVGPWLGEVRIAPVPYQGVPDTAFVIFLDDVPPAYCTEMVRALFDLFQIVEIQGTVIKDMSQTPPLYGGSGAQVLGACATGAPSRLVFTQS